LESEIKIAIDTILVYFDEYDERLLKRILEYNISEYNAKKLICLIPIAFGRKLMKKINFPDFYILNGKDKIKYSEDIVYIEIEKIIEKIIVKGIKSNDLIKIGGRSAEFHAVNSLLNQNPNVDWSEIRMEPVNIIY